MADPLGAALGALSVAGLLTVCLDCFNFVEDGLSLGKDFVLLEGQFSALRIRLFAWGKACGFTAAEGPDERLDHPAWKQHIHKQLNCISLLFLDAAKIIRKYDLAERRELQARGPVPAPDAEFIDEGLRAFLHRLRKTNKRAGLKGAFKWALSDKKKFTELLYRLKDCIEALELASKNFLLFDDERRIVEGEIEGIENIEILQNLIYPRDGSSTFESDVVSDAASERILQLQSGSGSTRADLTPASHRPGLGSSRSTVSERLPQASDGRSTGSATIPGSTIPPSTSGQSTPRHSRRSSITTTSEDIDTVAAGPTCPLMVRHEHTIKSLFSDGNRLDLDLLQKAGISGLMDIMMARNSAELVADTDNMFARLSRYLAAALSPFRGSSAYEGWSSKWEEPIDVIRDRIADPEAVMYWYSEADIDFLLILMFLFREHDLSDDMASSLQEIVDSVDKSMAELRHQLAALHIGRNSLKKLDALTDVFYLLQKARQSIYPFHLVSTALEERWREEFDKHLDRAQRVRTVFIGLFLIQGKRLSAAEIDDLGDIAKQDFWDIRGFRDLETDMPYYLASIMIRTYIWSTLRNRLRERNRSDSSPGQGGGQELGNGAPSNED